MTRTNILERTDDGPRVIGWFDPARATKYHESTTWDGSNRVSDATGSHTEHEILYRTAGGRWILHRWSAWQGVAATYRYVDDAAAREWLLRCGHDDAVAEHLGPVAEESEPPRVGRPPEGVPIQVRIPAEHIAQVDALASAAGVTRPEWIRQAIAERLARA